ncbi:MAG: 3-dehydroquinate synthase [Bacteroidota bacterium]
MSLSSITYQIHGTSKNTLISSDSLNDIIQDQSNIVFITDEMVMSHHSAFFSDKKTIVVPYGEKNKNLETLSILLEKFLNLKLERGYRIVGVGGGMITDLTGFAASIYKRGVRFGFVPTTLTAMVDASIGGKNGINIGDVKNIVGTVSQPEFIHIQTQFLQSLPKSMWSDGFAEIIKHALIGNEVLCNDLLASRIEDYSSDEVRLEKLIFDNISQKVKLVEQDPFDTGIRNSLNFGHTLGHTLEKKLNLTHGQAVAVGMNFASWLSTKTSTLTYNEYEMILQLLSRYNLPLYQEFDLDAVFESLLNDKKKQDENIRFVLLENIGKSVIHNIDITSLKSYISTWKNLQS